MTGQIPQRANIIAISNASPCEIQTESDHEFSTDDFVRLTDLNGSMPTLRGEDTLNNHRFQIIVTATDKFTLKYPITHLPVDSTTFPPYVEGGSCNVIAATFFYYGD